MTPQLTDELLRISRLFGLFERDAVCCGTVTVAQCMALQLLRGGSLENAAMAQATGVTPGAATRLVDGLVKHGWADRTRGETDRRQVHIGLTDVGRAEADRLRGLTEQAVGAIVAQVPEDRRADVLDAVQVLRQAMEDVGDVIRGCCG